MLTFGPSPGMHAAEARLSFLCCQKSCWRLMCPFIHRVLSATESRKHFLILPEVMVWHLSEGVTVAAMPFLRHKVQNAASVFEFRSYAEHLFNDIYSRNNVLWERRSHWIRKYVYQIDQSNLCVCVFRFSLTVSLPHVTYFLPHIPLNSPHTLRTSVLNMETCYTISMSMAVALAFKMYKF